jgi:hypothetical protein
MNDVLLQEALLQGLDITKHIRVWVMGKEIDL